MKPYIPILLIFLALILLAVPVVATDQTVKAGDYIEFNVYAPGADSIQFYVVGKNKILVSDPNDVSTKKLTKSELKEYLIDHMYYVYNKKDGNFTINLKINENSSAENHFDLGEYQLIVQHPNSDRIFNTKAEKAGGHGYNSGYDIITNGIFRFNIPACDNIEAAQKLVSAISEGNDISVTYKFTVVADGSKNDQIYVVPSTPSVPDTPVTIQDISQTVEIPTEPTPTEPIATEPIAPEPVKTPMPILGILSGIICGIAFLKRR